MLGRVRRVFSAAVGRVYTPKSVKEEQAIIKEYNDWANSLRDYTNRMVFDHEHPWGVSKDTVTASRQIEDPEILNLLENPTIENVNAFKANEFLVTAKLLNVDPKELRNNLFQLARCFERRLKNTQVLRGTEAEYILTRRLPDFRHYTESPGISQEELTERGSYLFSSEVEPAFGLPEGVTKPGQVIQGAVVNEPGLIINADSTPDSNISVESLRDSRLYLTHGSPGNSLLLHLRGLGIDINHLKEYGDASSMVKESLDAEATRAFDFKSSQLVCALSKSVDKKDEPLKFQIGIIDSAR